MTTVLPGESVSAQHVNLKLGPGLLQLSTNTTDAGSTIVSTRAGDLQHSANRSKWWVENNSRRYIPAAQESVIGAVVQRLGESFRVDIGTAQFASLDGLAFEGATKRNKPNLKVGSLVYARVSLAHKDMEPELECFDAQTRKTEGFGELKGGFVVRCSLKMCRDLLDPKHFLLPLLGGRFPLEAAVGMNGRVWVNAKEVKQIIAISRCIEAVDSDGGGMDVVGVKKLLDSLDA
ncbi:exosome complex exonuclease RRP40 [Cyathus striatus]|nr:exosome complex exonuclease RRP40 [Cyathus striatus]